MIIIRYVGVVWRNAVVGIVGACCPYPCGGKDSGGSLVKGEYRNTVKDGQDHRLGQKASSNPVPDTWYSIKMASEGVEEHNSKDQSKKQISYRHMS